MVHIFCILLIIHEKNHGYPNSRSISIPSKAPTLTPSTPSTRKSKTARRAATGCLSRRSKCSPVTSRLRAGLICSKPSLDDRRGADIVFPTTKRWVKAGKKVIEMSSQKACALFQGCVRSSHDECHQEHCPRQPYHIESDDKERDLLASIVLRICVCNAKNESYWC